MGGQIFYKHGGDSVKWAKQTDKQNEWNGEVPDIFAVLSAKLIYYCSFIYLFIKTYNLFPK